LCCFDGGTQLRPMLGMCSLVSCTRSAVVEFITKMSSFVIPDDHASYFAASAFKCSS